MLVLLLASCSFEQPTSFSKKALNDKVYDITNKQFTFQEVLNQYKGKKVLIDVWASWCRDCLIGLPKVKQLQEEFPEVVFLFLSVDTKQSSWKRGIRKYNIKGEHYNLPKGMKQGNLVDFLNLNWIPRYVVLDELGNITLFKATKASDKDITAALKISL